MPTKIPDREAPRVLNRAERRRAASQARAKSGPSLASRETSGTATNEKASTGTRIPKAFQARTRTHLAHQAARGARQQAKRDARG